MLGSAWRWLRWQRVPTARMPLRSPRAETRLWLLFAVAYVGAAVLTGLVVRWQPLPLLGAVGFTLDWTYLVGFKIGLLLVLPCLVAWRQGVRPSDLLVGWRPGPWALVMVGLAAAVGFSLNLGHLGGLGEALATRTGAETTLILVAGLTLPLLSAGLPEEIVYRGLLQTRLERSWGRLPALLATALLFTAWHLPTRYLLASGVEGQAGDLLSVLTGTGLPVLIVGLVFGLAWDRWRNLPALVAAHWAIDCLPFMSSLAGVAH